VKARLIKRLQAGVESNQYSIQDRRGYGVPLSDVGPAVAVLRGSAGAGWRPRSLKVGFSLRGVLRVPSIVPRIPRISSLRPSSLPLSYSMCGISTPNLRVRSISHVTLKSCLARAGKQIGPKPINKPFQIFDCYPHGFVEVVRTLSLDHRLQHVAHVETVFGQVHMILVVDHPVLVVPSVGAHKWVQESTDPN